MFLCPLSHTVQTPFQAVDNQHGVIEHLNFGLGANERPPSRQLSVLPPSSSVFSSIFHDLRRPPLHPSRHPLRTCLVNSCRRVVSFRGGQNLPRTTPRTPRHTSFLLSFRPPHGLPQGLVPPQRFDNSTVDTMKSRAPMQLCAQLQADILLKKLLLWAPQGTHCCGVCLRRFGFFVLSSVFPLFSFFMCLLLIFMFTSPFFMIDLRLIHFRLLSLPSSFFRVIFLRVPSLHLEIFSASFHSRFAVLHLMAFGLFFPSATLHFRLLLCFLCLPSSHVEISLPSSSTVFLSLLSFFLLCPSSTNLPPRPTSCPGRIMPSIRPL